MAIGGPGVFANLGPNLTDAPHSIHQLSSLLGWRNRHHEVNPP